MRNIYFMDQTKEFYDKDYDIVFLGNLFLKGKPYTNPKEAVDKEYVDNAFANITEENLKGSKVEAKNFPAFNGDLINKEGQNNFQLKEVLLKPGKYHRLVFDAQGRVTGGVEGNYVFRPGDMEKIDFSIIKRDGKTSIYDWTNGFDSSKYLMIDKDNIINKPLALNTKTLKTGHTVINENDVMTVSEQYFLGELGTLKRDGQHPGDNYFLPVNEYNVINGRPDKFQFNFSPKITNPIKKEPSRTINIKDIGFYGTRRIKPVTFVLGNYLYICHNNALDDDARDDFRIKLTEDGRLPEVINPERITFPHVDPSIGGHRNENTVTLRFIRNNLYMTSLVGNIPWDQAFRSEIKMNGSNVYFDKYLTHLQDGDINVVYIENKLTSIGIDGYLSWASPLDENFHTPQRNNRLPGNTTVSFSNAYNVSPIYFPIGSYIYVFYGERTVVSNTTALGDAGNNLCYRIKYSNGTPYGEFETVKLGGTLEDGLPEVITTGKYVIIFSLAIGSWSPNRGSLYAHYYEIQENGDLKFERKELILTKMLEVTYSVVASKGSLFFVNRQEIREIPFEGVESSYLDKIK